MAQVAIPPSAGTLLLEGDLTCRMIIGNELVRNDKTTYINGMQPQASLDISTLNVGEYANINRTFQRGFARHGNEDGNLHLLFLGGSS